MTSTRSRSPGISYQELLDSDSRAVNPYLRLISDDPIGPVRIPASRYTSRPFFDLEVEKVWKRTWQMACREEHIPDVGDTYVYDVVGLSILVVRSAPDRIRAFPNACLHRGRQLRTGSGHAGDVLRCPFHAMAWHLDGTLANLTCPWDFPHVDPAGFSLPEVPVGVWEGWVFVNPHPAPSTDLATHLGDLPAHFAKWAPGRKYVSAHVGKELPVNWKVAQEAFMEAFHVVATHPQIGVSTGDCNSQYDVFGTFSRAITPSATPSPHLAWQPTEQQIFDSMTDRRLDQQPTAVVPDGMTARAFVAASGRRRHHSVPGIAGYCDAEMVDSLYYTLFPNFHPWGAFNRINYRFRPLGRQVDACLMECIYTDEFEGDRPPPAPYVHLGLEDEWAEAVPQLGLLARVFQQDSFNLPAVQRGLEAMGDRAITLSSYQETKIRHLHHLLDQHLAR